MVLRAVLLVPVVLRAVLLVPVVLRAVLLVRALVVLLPRTALNTNSTAIERGGVVDHVDS